MMKNFKLFKKVGEKIIIKELKKLHIKDLSSYLNDKLFGKIINVSKEDGSPVDELQNFLVTNVSYFSNFLLLNDRYFLLYSDIITIVGDGKKITNAEKDPFGEEFWWKMDESSNNIEIIKIADLFNEYENVDEIISYLEKKLINNVITVTELNDTVIVNALKNILIYEVGYENHCIFVNNQWDLFKGDTIRIIKKRKSNLEIDPFEEEIWFE